MPSKKFATFHIETNLFGIDIRLIREMNRNVEITPVQRVPEFVRGLLNLRGQIVTVVDVGVRMGLRAPHSENRNLCCIVLKTSDELSSKRVEDESIEDTSPDIVALQVDDIGDIADLEEKDIEPAPANTGEVEGRFISGVAKLEKELMVILKVTELLCLEEERTTK